MFKLTKFLFIVAFWLPLSLYAQFTLSGKVLEEESGNTLPGAHIKLNNKLTISNNDGTYSFNNLAEGQYQLEVSYLGYEKFVKTLSLSKNQYVEIKLSIKPITEETVVISANRATDKTGTSFTNLAKADIKKADVGVDLPYILDMTPSLITSSDAGAGVGYTYMRVRGSDITRINVTVNGIPLNDPESQGVFFVNMPDFASSLNSIQVQRGVGTSVNGPSAFGASIDLQTQGISNQPAAELGFVLWFF